ncbi:MAG: hypothetical protein H7A37_06480 [Chlamydiales bacterium]|nr:hypothetical protein [Chlamydiales bacterium]
MTQIFTKEEIICSLDRKRVIALIEEGFLLYSSGQVVTPPFGSLHFDEPPGDVHIKYGYIHHADDYVVKIASGFHDNPTLGLPASQGLMLLFCRKTGSLKAILLDEGYLTDCRTAAAGAVAAKYFAPKQVDRIGIVGTGTQALMQLCYLKEVTPCRDVIVWGRNKKNLAAYCSHPDLQDFDIIATEEIKMVTDLCNVIVTTTPSKKPLLIAGQVRAGTHITAVGADGGGKQELEAALFGKADIVCNDSRMQCFEHGDTSYAIKQEIVDRDKIVELGEVVRNPALGRSQDDQITIADLTGNAVQDIQIATAIYEGMIHDRID